MTSTAQTKREAVASAVRTAMESLDGGWAIYSQPNDVVSLPALVVGPGSPYRAPDTMGGFSMRHERLRMRLHMFATRGAGNTALDMFDTATDACLTGLDAVTSYSTEWSGLNLIGTVEVNGQEALGATLDIDVL